MCVSAHLGCIERGQTQFLCGRWFPESYSGDSLYTLATCTPTNTKQQQCNFKGCTSNLVLTKSQGF